MLLYSGVEIAKVKYIFFKNINLSGKEKLIMAKCELCEKSTVFGIKVSHSHRRANRAWSPNIKKVRVNINGTSRRMHICTRCMRSGKLGA